MKIIIYKIVNKLNDMAYIGYTTKNLNDSIFNYGSKELKTIIKKEGEKNFKIVSLEIYESKTINDNQIQLKKNKYINQYKTDINGYNINKNIKKDIKKDIKKSYIFYLFKITNTLNNMAYIGLTGRKDKIDNNDIYALSNEQIKIIVNKEGSNHFKLEVLREYYHELIKDVNDDELLLKKVKYINKYDTFNNGYNNYIPFKHHF